MIILRFANLNSLFLALRQTLNYYLIKAKDDGGKLNLFEKMVKTFVIWFFLGMNVLCSQTSSWRQVCVLDQNLSHSSGILSLNKGETFWTQDDNTGPAVLFEFDKSCKLLKTLKINNVTKTDWEDITHDGNGTVFIGDFGNNNNNRKDLKIYILKDLDKISGDTISAKIIRFNYADQDEFPPELSKRNYDMEAMIWFSDSLHLFSKNRTEPFTGYTYHYKMPAQAGNYSISPVDSFKTGDGPMIFYWITGAAMDIENKRFVLLSHDRIWQFNSFGDRPFFRGNSTLITLPNYTQKEGICYSKDHTWYLTDEYNTTLRQGGNLYEMKLNPVTNNDEIPDIEFVVYPNPAQQFLNIILPAVNEDNAEKIKIYDAMGRVLMNYSINKIRSTIPLEDLQNGIYIISHTSKVLKKCFSKRIIVFK